MHAWVPCRHPAYLATMLDARLGGWFGCVPCLQPASCLCACEHSHWTDAGVQAPAESEHAQRHACGHNTRSRMYVLPYWHACQVTRCEPASAAEMAEGPECQGWLGQLVTNLAHACSHAVGPLAGACIAVLARRSPEPLRAGQQRRCSAKHAGQPQGWWLMEHVAAGTCRLAQAPEVAATHCRSGLQNCTAASHAHSPLQAALARCLPQARPHCQHQPPEAGGKSGPCAVVPGTLAGMRLPVGCPLQNACIRGRALEACPACGAALSHVAWAGC